ncbi:MAG: IS1634 family transposase [Erysipelotrichaceae bacterium]
MRISIRSSKNHEFIYIIKDFYNNKSRTTKTFQKLGKIDELCKEKNMSREEVISWAKSYALSLTEKEKNENKDTIIPFSPDKIIDFDTERKFNCGYLFLQDIYYHLKLDTICRNFKRKYAFEFDINAILSDLIYSRILFPSSKRSTYEQAYALLEQPKYELHDVYRALSILSKESDYIQAELYKNSHFVKKRNTSTLYYDCTNYYFEIEEDDDFRKYGKSKEHRPNPIVGMGLMMDGDGIPLAFDMYEGNKNEQRTLKPLEKRIIKDFELSKFIYCSDAGLASKTNKKFNSLHDRAYIITQSLKKLKKEDKEVALKHTGFLEVGSQNSQRINIDEIDFHDETNRTRLFYKEIPLETPVKERLIVTYSPKYAIYQKNIRDKQIQRAINTIQKNGKLKNSRKNPNDPARFIEKITTDTNGEVIEEHYTLDIAKINEEAMYDGFYAITTNLEDEDVKAIISVSERRWQIEECFRIMKTDFKARPVYLQNRDRIEAHFLTCFISLIIYRLLADKLDNKYTVTEILKTLRDMELVDTKYNGYIPAYKRTEITDELHTVFGFRTDYEILSKKKMRNIIKNTKSQ